MRILVAIANHGHGNRRYLERLLSSYRSMSHEVDIVILSNVPKDLGPDVEVRVGVPTENPWSLPFAHRELFLERQDGYALFIYSEDDTLVTESNVDAFLRDNAALQPDEIPGFIRLEESDSGDRYCSSIHSFFRWRPETVQKRGNDLFAELTNEHSACTLLTREHLKSAIASGGFTVEPYEARYGMLETAATDVYTRCGLRRLINISRLSDFVLPHLPNKYIGRIGLPWCELERQTSTLASMNDNAAGSDTLVPVETQYPRARWSKMLYSDIEPPLMNLIPGAARDLLIVGSGLRQTELELQKRGHRLTCVAIDTLFAELLKQHGVEAVSCRANRLAEVLEGRQFDCVLLDDVIGRVPDPPKLLQDVTGTVRKNGTVVATAPNMTDIVSLRRKPQHRVSWQPYDQVGIHRCTPTALRRWMTESGWKVQAASHEMSDNRRRFSQRSLGVFDPLISTSFGMRAVRENGCP